MTELLIVTYNIDVFYNYLLKIADPAKYSFIYKSPEDITDNEDILNLYSIILFDVKIENFYKITDVVRLVNPNAKLMMIGQEFSFEERIQALKNKFHYIDISKPEEFYSEVFDKMIDNDVRIIFDNPRQNWFNFTINSVMDFSNEISELIAYLGKNTLLSEDELFQIQFVLRELQDNAIEHAHKFDELKKVKVSSVIMSDCIVIKVEDEGMGFDVSSLIDPLEELEKNIKTRIADGKRPGGLGIAMARRVMDSVTFNEKGNTVIMVKFFDVKKKEQNEEN